MSSGAEAPARRRPNLFLIASVVLLVISLGFAIYFGIAWTRASTSDDAKYGKARDDALRAGEQMAINFTSLDYHHMDRTKKNLERSTTGSLHDQVSKTIGQYKKPMSQMKLVTKSDLVEGAVVNLDTHQNKASVLAVINSTSKASGGGAKGKKGKEAKPQTQRLPIVIGLTRDDAGSRWKANSVSGAPGMSGQPQQSPSGQ